MPHTHVSFLIDLAGRIGPAVFSATLVGCLLAERFAAMHAILLAFGFGMIVLHHWHSSHRN